MQRPPHSSGSANPSVSARAAKIVDDIAANADALRITVSTGSQGERLIDMGGRHSAALKPDACSAKFAWAASAKSNSRNHPA